MTNALQHAHPDTVSVTIESIGAYLILTVKNNGLIAEQNSRDPRRGRGLSNMATRSKELGGDFSFSICGQEAVVKAVLPAVNE